jgi:rhamnogalacturonan endolyase
VVFNHLIIKSFKMLFTSGLTLLFATSVMAISIKSESGKLKVDTGGNLVVTFDSENCDITSIEYKGIDYQSQLAYSHLASGLGSDASVEYDTIGMFDYVSAHIPHHLNVI